MTTGKQSNKSKDNSVNQKTIRTTILNTIQVHILHIHHLSSHYSLIIITIPQMASHQLINHSLINAQILPDSHPLPKSIDSHPNTTMNTSFSSNDTIANQLLQQLPWWQRLLIRLYHATCQNRKSSLPSIRQCQSIKHIAFIMDGNRRFARQKRMTSVLDGHKEGQKALERVLHWCLAFGITDITVYAFSQDNFKRDETEVDGLMAMAMAAFTRYSQDSQMFHRYGIRLKACGRLELLPEAVRSACQQVMQATAHHKNATVNVCLAYSGAEEMKDVLAGQQPFVPLDPPVDLLVRTSGEHRLSDFLPLHLSAGRRDEDSRGEPESQVHKKRHGLLMFIRVLWPEIGFWSIWMAIMVWRIFSSMSKSSKKQA